MKKPRKPKKDKQFIGNCDKHGENVEMVKRRNKDGEAYMVCRKCEESR